MKPDTLAFIESLFEYYRDTSSGKEPDNVKALDDAWDDLTIYRHRKDEERKVLAKLYAVIHNEPNIGLWELGAAFTEILLEYKTKNG